MLSSIFISESITGMGSAINHAGSLRMQSFRIATDLVYQLHDNRIDNEEGHRYANYVHDFDARIRNQKLKNVIPSNHDSAIYKRYVDVLDTWEYKIKPLLYVYEKMGNQQSIIDYKYDEKYWDTFTDTSRRLIRQRYMDLVEHFVNKIDRMVVELELETEKKIKLLNVIELISLFLAIIIVLITMIVLQSRIISPLQSLMMATEKIREGDFSYKAIVNGNNELSRLANTFNAMSTELSETYISQAEEISRKTNDLKQKKDEMELLYHTAEILSSSPANSKSYEKIITEIKQKFNIRSVIICLSKPDSAAGHLLSSSLENYECSSNCKKCHTNRGGHDLIFPIEDINRSYGLLIIERSQDDLDEWQTSTLKIISEQIASAINIVGNSIKDRDQALIRERSMIARDLHDSLAQSLSYLKIEVSRVQDHMNKNMDSTVITPIISDIRDEISNAYQQLRKLITTFRLTVDSTNLENTINNAIEDFKQLKDVDMTVDVRATGCEMNPSEAMHLIYILRESLNNIYKHANASHVWVELRCAPSHQITLTVQDNGDGLSSDAKKHGHHGLSIMQERASLINGTYGVSLRPGGGTSIEVSFTPVQHRNHSTNGNIESWISQL